MFGCEVFQVLGEDIARRRYVKHRSDQGSLGSHFENRVVILGQVFVGDAARFLFGNAWIIRVKLSSAAALLRPTIPAGILLGLEDCLGPAIGTFPIGLTPGILLFPGRA